MLGTQTKKVATHSYEHMPQLSVDLPVRKRPTATIKILYLLQSTVLPYVSTHECVEKQIKRPIQFAMSVS